MSGLLNASLVRIAQVVGAEVPEEEVYDLDAELEGAAANVEELHAFLEQLRAEQTLSEEQIEDLEIHIWELQAQVEALAAWSGQAIEWSNSLATTINEISERMNTLEEAQEKKRAEPQSYVSEGSQWWDDYLRRNPYPYPVGSY